MVFVSPAKKNLESFKMEDTDFEPIACDQVTDVCSSLVVYDAGEAPAAVEVPGVSPGNESWLGGFCLL